MSMWTLVTRVKYKYNHSAMLPWAAVLLGSVGTTSYTQGRLDQVAILHVHEQMCDGQATESAHLADLLLWPHDQPRWRNLAVRGLARGLG
jgi:hypothetical protein